MVEKLSRFLRGRYAWISLLLVLPAMAPLLASGYFLNAHDARHSVFFLVEFDSVFRAGALWPYWGPDFAVGFGYPLWLVYAPLAYYVGEAFHLLGLGFVASTKATWAVGFLVGGLGMYRLARRWWGPRTALVASVAFTYAPYHLVQIYVRAALAEFMATAWVPWAVLALYNLWERPGPRRAAIAALAIAALVLLHTVSALTFVPLLGGFVLLFFVRDVWRAHRSPVSPGRYRALQPAIGWTAAALMVAVLLTGIFLAPMVFERQYIQEAQWVRDYYTYSDHFVYFSQLFDPTWGYGYSLPGPDDGMSYQLGLVIAILAGVAGFGALLPRKPSQDERLKTLFLFAASVVAVFFMTSASAPLWAVLPLINLLQFPWRLLAVLVFTLALLAAAGAHYIGGKSDRELIYPYAFVAVIILVSLPYVRAHNVPVQPRDEQPLAIIDFELQFPDMRGMTRWSERLPVNADSPLIAQYQTGRPLQRVTILSGQGEVLEQSAAATVTQARVRADTPIRLRFFSHYFPGWQATVDGKRAEITADAPNGLIGLDLPAGEHEVIFRFGMTAVRRTGAALSVAGLLLTALMFVFGRRQLASLA